jgi:hypothetical protein
VVIAVVGQRSRARAASEAVAGRPRSVMAVGEHRYFQERHAVMDHPSAGTLPFPVDGGRVGGPL